MDKKRCTAIVLAAGKGTRMGTKIPKQFLHISGRPVLYYSLECFERSRVIDDIILVTAAEMISYCKEELKKYGTFQKLSAVISGGAERYDSVYAGLKACKGTDYVYIHDGARPFVTEEMLQRAYEDVEQYGACAAAVPAKDTVKIIDAQGMVAETPARSLVWNVQTPQVFSYGLIAGAYERLQNLDKTGITDDAMVVEHTMGHPVHLFMGSYRNIKITTEEDLESAEIFCKKMFEKSQNPIDNDSQ